MYPWCFAALLAACGGDVAEVSVGGSSSLQPLSEAVARHFAALRPDVGVSVAVFGSIGGFRRLCDGQLDVAAASRPISTAEAERCRVAGVRPLAVPIARDGVTVIVNRLNAAARCLTLDELGRLWEPGSAVATWQDLRPSFPPVEIQLFGSGPGSGTFEFFTSMVVGRPGASRTDAYQTGAANLVAHGVAQDRWALGYLGSTAFAASSDRVRAVAVDTGFGCVNPTDQAVSGGAYSPLSRDLYLYVARAALDRAEVYAFVQNYVAFAERASAPLGYVPLPAAEYARNSVLVAAARMGPP